MHIDPINYTFAKVARYLQAKLYMQLVRVLVEEKIIRIICIYFIFVILGSMMGRLALAISHDRPSPGEVLGRYQMGCH